MYVVNCPDYCQSTGLLAFETGPGRCRRITSLAGTCSARLGRKDEEICSLAAPRTVLSKRRCRNRQPLDRLANHPIEPRHSALAVAILKVAVPQSIRPTQVPGASGQASRWKSSGSQIVEVIFVFRRSACGHEKELGCED
jgi:hypothetical protein